MDWMCDRRDCNFVSADVSKRKSGNGANWCESRVCRPYTRHVRDENFWKIVIPTAGPGIASGTILTFARAMGEYGATSMLAGNIQGKTGTIAQKIAMVIQDGDYVTAGIWVSVVVLIAFVIIFLWISFPDERWKIPGGGKRWRLICWFGKMG